MQIDIKLNSIPVLILFSTDLQHPWQTIK
ncbi:hypothetical protein NC652_019325 [Populus alba x Populus x berolinensis]|nr:hypothetical protein NC652_019325 [Populus alba x Populus x berolinensis]